MNPLVRLILTNNRYERRGVKHPTIVDILQTSRLCSRILKSFGHFLP